jgi:excisionase family DNA binding protein
MEPLLTVKEIARYLRVHTSTIYRLLKTPDFPRVKVGDYRFHPKAIDTWTQKHTVTKGDRR